MLPASHEQTSEPTPPLISVSQYLFSFAEACFQRSAWLWIGFDLLLYAGSVLYLEVILLISVSVST